MNTALYAFAWLYPLRYLFQEWSLRGLFFEKIKHRVSLKLSSFMPYVYKYNRYRDCIPLLLQWRLRDYQFLLRFDWYSTVNWLDNVNKEHANINYFGVWTCLAFNIIILLAG